MKNRDWQIERIPNDPIISNTNDHRGPYEIDKNRVIHTFPFRRLQGKFQMISGDECDFNRNRLTHSLEVASIAKNIYLKLKKEHETIPQVNTYLFNKDDILESTTLLETISLLHVIGNPPFGHAGEVALNFKMRDYGGFEGNAQGLHMLTNCEKFFPLEKFQLTKRTLLGILKYPVNYSKVNERPTSTIISNESMKHEEWKPPKCYYDSEISSVRTLLTTNSSLDDYFFNIFTQDTLGDGNSPNHKKSIHRTFDCSIMDVADDISNAIHDLEDVIYLNLIKENDFNNHIKDIISENESFFNNALKDRTNCKIDKLVSNLFIKEENKQAIGDLVYLCVNSCEIDPIEIFSKDDDIFKYNVKLKNPCDKLVIFLKNYILKNVIKSPNVQTIVHGGMMVIMKLFDAYESNPEALLSPEWYKIYKNNDENDKKRIICNFIAGMTDAYAYRIYSRLYGHNNSNMFDKI